MTVANAAVALSFGVAPGSLIAVDSPSLDANTDVARLSLRFESGPSRPLHASVAAPATGRGLLAVVPEGIPLGPAVVTLLVDGAPAPGPNALIEIVPASIGLFMSWGNVQGPAVAQNIDAAGTASVNSLSNPALPGNYVTLWATGLGRFGAADVTVLLAGKPLEAVFAGRAPGMAGMDQINFIMPADAPDGCYLPVSVRAGQYISNEATISKASSAGGCPHPLGLSPEQLQALDEGRSFPHASIHIGNAQVALGLASPGSVPEERAHLTANLNGLNAQYLFSLFAPDQVETPESGCHLELPALDRRLPPTLPAARAQSVLPLTLTGPGGRTAEISPVPNAAFYSQDIGLTPPRPFLAAGTWQLSMPAGSAIGPFRQTFDLPRVQIANRDSLGVINRWLDYPVTWDPSGYSPGDVMRVWLWNGYRSLIAGSHAVAMSCTAPAQAGQLVMPATLLARIARTPGPEPGLLQLYVHPRPSALPRFAIPVSGGAAGMPAAIVYSLADSVRVAIR